MLETVILNKNGRYVNWVEVNNDTYTSRTSYLSRTMNLDTFEDGSLVIANIKDGKVISIQAIESKEKIIRSSFKDYFLKN